MSEDKKVPAFDDSFDFDDEFFDLDDEFAEPAPPAAPAPESGFDDGFEDGFDDGFEDDFDDDFDDDFADTADAADAPAPPPAPLPESKPEPEPKSKPEPKPAPKPKKQPGKHKRKAVLPLLLLCLLIAVGGFFAVRALFSRGGVSPEQAKVPALTGLTADEAETALAEEKLNLIIAGRAEGVTDNGASVVSQSSVAGSILPAGGCVRVSVAAEPQPMTVPDLTGFSLDAALKLLAERGFACEYAEGADEKAAPGSVISQEPAAGTFAAAGSTVTLSVNGPDPVSGSDLHTTGSYIGEDFYVARMSAQSEGIALCVTGYVYNRKTPAGQITAQQIAEGRRQQKGMVGVTISLGAEPVTVPDLRYVSGSDAETILRDLGLAVEKTTGEDPRAADGLVTGQQPEPGTMLIAGDSVSLVVCSNSDIVVPDLSGMTVEECAAALFRSGLQMEKYECSAPKGKRGTCVAQEPAPGASVRRGSTVSVGVFARRNGKPGTRLSLSYDSLELAVGESAWLAPSLGKGLDDARGVTCTSSDPSVADVVDGTTCTVRAVNPGIAVITAEAPGAEPVTCRVTVRAELAYIAMTSPSDLPGFSTATGFDKTGIVITAHYTDGMTQSVADHCIFDAPDMSKKGAGIVKVSYTDGITRTLSLPVRYDDPSISITPDSLEVGIYCKKQLPATTSPEGAVITWESSDPKIAEVDENGVVTGKALGSCTITGSIYDGAAIDACSVTVKKVMYLTFDDGPNKNELRILPALKRNKAKATFFVMYHENFDSYYKRIIDEGHALGLHSYTHDFDKCYASTDAFYKEIYKLQDHIEKCAGVRPMLIRCPGGTNNLVGKSGHHHDVMTGIVDRAEAEGFRIFDWTCSAGDSSESSNLEYCYNHLHSLIKGDSVIVLMHERYYTADLLNQIIPEYRARGYVFESLTIDTPHEHFPVA